MNSAIVKHLTLVIEIIKIKKFLSGISTIFGQPSRNANGQYIGANILLSKRHSAVRGEDSVPKSRELLYRCQILAL